MNAVTTHELFGAYLTGVAVGVLVALLAAVVLLSCTSRHRHAARPTRPLAGDDTTRITPTHRSTFEKAI